MKKSETYYQTKAKTEPFAMALNFSFEVGFDRLENLSVFRVDIVLNKHVCLSLAIIHASVKMYVFTCKKCFSKRFNNHCFELVLSQVHFETNTQPFNH